MNKWAICAFFLVSGCVGPRVQTTGLEPVGQTPPAWLFEGIGPGQEVKTARYLGKFKITYYWVVEEKDYPAKNRTVPLYTKDGKLLGRFHPSFVKDFKTESAGRLKDGRKISYLKLQNRVQVVNRFLGNGGHTLTELKSIAVDPSIIPLGSKVYIPQAEKVIINGKPLTGIFYAHDIGGSVRGRHVDIFLGKKENLKLFTSGGMPSSSIVDVYLLE